MTWMMTRSAGDNVISRYRFPEEHFFLP